MAVVSHSAWSGTDAPPQKSDAYEKISLLKPALRVYTARQAAALAKRMPDLIVRHAMTYGNFLQTYCRN